MVLAFKPEFEKPIRIGTKIHTIREDKTNRWYPGRTIHFATGVRTKKYLQFKYGFVRDIQHIIVENHNIQVDGWILHDYQMEILSKNDGFETLEKFFEFFDKPFSGKIIHWYRGNRILYKKP